jgi:hypothetical protein
MTHPSQVVSIHPCFKEKLKDPLAALNPDWFVFQCGVDRG